MGRHGDAAKIAPSPITSSPCKCDLISVSMNKPVTVKQIASKTQAKLTGEESIVITDVSHDSRRAGEGSLFVAVAGALFDAHKFIPQVMEHGAAGVISERPAPE